MTTTGASASDPRATATAILFDRYAAVIAAAAEDPSATVPFTQDPRLSLANLAWMCRTGAAEAATLPIDKTSRWLGFVQGCLAMRGLISVDAERDATRPLFHAAYEALGFERPESRESPAA